MNKSSTEVNQAIDELLNKNLVIEWEKYYDEITLSKYSLVPKGRIMDIKDEYYIFCAFPKAEHVNLSMMAYHLWRYAHSKGNCNNTIFSVANQTGVDIKDVKKEFIRWIPILVLYDLIAIVPKE
jgi:hypothetical protein